MPDSSFTARPSHFTHATTSIVLVLLSASLFTLSFPPFGFRAVAWIALAPLLVAIGRGGSGAAAALGGLWGFAAAVGVTHWLPATIADYYHQPYGLGLLIFVSATSFMVAAEYAVFAVCCSTFQRSTLAPKSLAIAAAWVVAEFARAHLLTGNPWAFLGYSQSGSEWTLRYASLQVLASPPTRILQIADATGVYGVSFVVATVNAAIAQCIIHLTDRSSGYAWRRELVAAALIVLGAFTYGQSRLSQRFDDGQPAAAIAIVQGNVDLGSQWLPHRYGRNLQRYLQLTERSFASSDGEPPRLVIWPENAMTFFVDEEPLFRDTISRTLGAHDVELLSGAPRSEPGDAQRFYNSAFLISPDGEIVARYDKQRLLPFAEYFPLGAVDLLRRSFGRVREFTSGTDDSPLPTVAGLAGVAICNEAMFGAMGRRRVLAGAEYLVNLSNDSWVRAPMFAEQQLDIAAMRAIEQRRYLVRASTSGPSAIVDPYGRVVARTETGTQALLMGRVRTTRMLSWYARHGDVFAIACCVLVGGLLAVRVSSVRKRRDPEA